jgi:hypothetical protein
VRFFEAFVAIVDTVNVLFHCDLVQEKYHLRQGRSSKNMCLRSDSCFQHPLFVL